jgi:elongation factor Ts
MAEITAALVKELREITGAGMMECKKALVEVEGDIEGAIDVLRTRGLAKAAEKAGRATNEGTIVALTSDAADIAVLCEINCETDFVGTNEKFKAYASKIAHAALENDVADIESLKTAAYEGETVDALLAEAIHTLGENIQIARFVRLTIADGAIVSYIHGGGTLGVLVAFRLGDPSIASSDAFQAIAKDVAMQVAAMNPVAVNREEVPADIVEHEKSIYKAQAAESGKPEAIQEKMAIGRLDKFFKECCLLEESFIKDGDQTVKSYIETASKGLGSSVEVVSFVRFALGDAE